MNNYRDEKPAYLSELTSDGIMSYFEDSRATAEDVNWMKNVLQSKDYQLKKNPVSPWNWGKIKTAFATKYFPEIAPVKVDKRVTMKDRVALFLDT